MTASDAGCSYATYLACLQLAVFNRIEPYTRDHASRMSQSSRRFSDMLDSKIRTLVRMHSRLSESSLYRTHVRHAHLGVSCQGGAKSRPQCYSNPSHILFQSMMESSREDDEVDDGTYVISPIDVDVTYAVTSAAREDELQVSWTWRCDSLRH